MIYERVLLSTDFSANARNAGVVLTGLPVREAVLLHVLTQKDPSIRGWINGDTMASPIEHARVLLAKEQEFLEQHGIAVKPMIIEISSGFVQDAILKSAEQERVSCIMVGARGKGIIRGYILGSVSSDVLRRSSTDVLIVQSAGSHPAGQEDLFRKVLCPVDFSRPSTEMIGFVSSLGGVGEILLLHVIRSAESGHELAYLLEDAENKLIDLRNGLRKRGFSAQTLVRTGSPAQEICRCAESEDVSLVLLSRCGGKDYVTNVPLGSTTTDVARNAQRPLLVRHPAIIICQEVRELVPDEFRLAEELWQEYHQQKGDERTDRIFGVFLDGILAGVARCRKHPDDLEVDAVFVPEKYRGRGYAKKVVAALVNACGDSVLYMHSTLELVNFYGEFRFEPIREQALPKTIRERFSFAGGEMQGSNVCPMKRVP
jgi:nucleotide-binding universal stress UspA family protein/predicted GNAT family acetyltransferase